MIHVRNDGQQFDRTERLFEDPASPRHSGSHRNPEAVLRQLPADGDRSGPTRGQGAAGRAHQRVSHRGLQQHGGAGVRQLQPGDAEVRCARVHGAGDELRRTAEGPRASRGARQGRQIAHQESPGRTRAGGLHRRTAADDRARHVHHQRDRAGGGKPVAPLARGLLHA